MTCERQYFDPARMEKLDAGQVGSIGEYFVASLLSGYGYEVHHTKTNGYDLLAVVPGLREYVRVDVKTQKNADKPRNFRIWKGKNTTIRDYEVGDCDIFALVCLEDMSVMFTPCELYDGKKNVYVNREEHIQTDPYESWSKAVVKSNFLTR